MTRHPLLITPGDPAGIGPEISLKALTQDAYLRSQTVLIGDKQQLGMIADRMGLDVAFANWQAGMQTSSDHINLAEITWPQTVLAGTPDTQNAAMVISAIEMAVRLVQNGHGRAITTCPIAKSTLYDSGFSYPGHTEYLGALANSGTPIMMLANDKLRVVPATIHIPLSHVPHTLSQDDLAQLIQNVAISLTQDFGISTPHIAVCGLNPHAGENGTIGEEEITIISPAIEQARTTIINSTISGPHAADSLFHPEKYAGYDCVIGMYHDQVLIPVKTIDFHGSVNVTLGLDFVRTSPDHGTAFDIAGTYNARPDSLMASLYMADHIAKARQAAGA